MGWTGKVVVVTGGSSGLGREICRAFATSEATVISIARNEATNLASCESMLADGLTVHPLGADVTSDDEIQEAISAVITEFGRIDVWVNNVGRSTRAVASGCDVDTFREFMDVNFYSVVRCTRAVIDHLSGSNGHLVNIGSLAGRTAWPWMAPYSVSKHAVAVYSAQLRIERAGKPHVLHVCPGPIQRSSSDPVDRYADQSDAVPESARKPGAGAPVKGIRPEILAAKIVRACENRKPELLIPWKSRILFTLSGLSTRAGEWLIRRKTSGSRPND